MLEFTRQERWILIVLVGTLFLGIIVTGIQRYQDETHLTALEASYHHLDDAYRIIAVEDSGDTASHGKKQIQKSSIPDSLRLDINRADEKALVQLPRIGPVLARRIVEYRTQKGPFKKLEDMKKVKGIGPKTLERIRPYIFIK